MSDFAFSEALGAVGLPKVRRSARSTRRVMGIKESSCPSVMDAGAGADGEGKMRVEEG